MSVIFCVLGVIFYFIGISIFASASSAIHECVSMLSFVVGTLFCIGSAILSKLDKIEKNLPLSPKDEEKSKQIGDLINQVKDHRNLQEKHNKSL